MKRKTWERVKAEKDAGRPWKAKEILRGHIRQSDYNPKLYEAYGELLLESNEWIEAGKYLLLASAGKPEHEEPIEAFLERYGRAGPLHLFMTFPRKARLTRLSKYPEPLRSTLEGIGLAEVLASRPEEPDLLSPVPRRVPWLVAGCLGIAALAIVSAVVGLVTIARWLFGV